MKQLLFLLLLSSQALAQGAKDPMRHTPTWSIAIQFDHISFPSFNKFRPKGNGIAHYFKSWSVSASHVLNYPSDRQGIFHQAYLGVLKNEKLQKGFRLGMQSGVTTESHVNPAPVFQAGIDAGGLLLVQRCRRISSTTSNMYPSFRLQWTGGLFMNGGVSMQKENYSAVALSYKLWMQGPYIRKHAAALPHQSLGILYVK